METNNLYSKIYNLSNLILAYKKARKGKTKKKYVIEFKKNLIKNLLGLQEELKNQTYKPQPLKIFILRDPKTRKISKSAFRDRIVHHAIVNVLEPIFDRNFIYDSCANRNGKGNLFALKRFREFFSSITKNNSRVAFCLKADIKHYFHEVNHEVLIRIIRRKVNDEEIIWLIKKILSNKEIGGQGQSRLQDFTKGMPLGNLTSQFFANIYLNELDRFVKHKLKAKFYIRYVDDFVILHLSKLQLSTWKQRIDSFLKDDLKLQLHPDKSRTISLSKGIDYVGFRVFYYHKLLRKWNVRSIYLKIRRYKKGNVPKEKMLEIFQGWNAYAKWANSLKLRREIIKKIYAEKS